MGKKRKPIQYVPTSKTSAAAYDPNTGQYLPQQYLPPVTIKADRALPFQDGKFAPWLAAKGITENDALADPIAMAAGMTVGGLRLGAYGLSQVPRMFATNLASEATSGLTDMGKIMTPRALKTFLNDAAERAQKQYMIQARGMFNKGPKGTFGRFTDLQREQAERRRLAELVNGEVDLSPWNNIKGSTEFPIDKFRTRDLANRGMDYYIRGDVSPVPSLSNPWLTQGDPGDVVREMGRTSYAKDIPEADQYLAWQNWEAAKNNLEVPPNVRLPIHDMRDRIVRNLDREESVRLNANIRRMPLGRGPETLNSTSDWTPTLKPGSYSVGAGDAFQSGNLGPNSFVTNADVPTTPTASQYSLLPKSLYDFNKPINTQINIADELGKGAYSRRGINPSPLVSDPNFILKGSNAEHVRSTMMTGAENAFNSPDFAKEYVQAYDPYRQGFDIAPSMGVKVPENENDIMLELMPRIQGTNLMATKGFTPAGKPIKLMSRDVAFDRLGKADINRFGAQTDALDKNFYFDGVGDNIMYTPDGRLHHIDMFPKLSGLKKRLYGEDIEPIMNSYKGAVLDKLTQAMPYYKDVVKDLEAGKITKDMANKMLETSMRVGNQFAQSAKLGNMDIDFNVFPKSLFAYGLSGLKKFKFGGVLKDVGLTVADVAMSPLNKDIINDGMYQSKDLARVTNVVGGLQNMAAPMVATALGGPAAGMAVSGAQQLSNGFVGPQAYMAQGGQLQDRTQGSFIQYNGPSHENGGIPVDASGIPTHPSMAAAEVEGGETSYKSYVFSDKLKDPKSGKTFADASKAIYSRYKGAEDSLSRRGFEREINRLMSSNEELRITKEMNSYKRSLKKFLPQKDWGGLTNDQWAQAGMQNAGNIAHLGFTAFSKPAKFPTYKNPYERDITAQPDYLNPASELARNSGAYVGLRRSLPGATGGQSAGLGALMIGASRVRANTDAAIYDRYNQANAGMDQARLSRMQQLGENDRASMQWAYDGTQKARANKDNMMFADVNAIGANVGNMYNQAAWNKLIQSQMPTNYYDAYMQSKSSAGVDPLGNPVSMRPGYNGPVQGPIAAGGNYPVNQPYAPPTGFNPQAGLPQSPRPSYNPFEKPAVFDASGNPVSMRPGYTGAPQAYESRPQAVPFRPLPPRTLNLNPYPSTRPPYYPPYEENLAPWATQAGPRLFKRGGFLYAY